MDTLSNTNIFDFSRLTSETARRRQLLDVMLVVICASAVLVPLILPLFVPEGMTGPEAEIEWIRWLALSVLGGSLIIFILNHYVSSTLASGVFLLAFLVMVVFSDEPEQVANGRGLLFFALPIVAASILWKPWASFVAAGLSSLLIWVLTLQLGSALPNISAMVGLFALALIVWLATRSLEHAIGTLHDTNEALWESEEKFRTIANHTCDWENWYSEDGQLLWVSPKVAHVTGYSVEECLAMSGFPRPLVFEGDRDVVSEAVRNSVDERTVHNNFPFRIQRKDGQMRWMSAAWNPVYDAEGTYRGVRSGIRDITEQKQAEEQLKTTLGEKEILLKEIHHRVKNNLQVIAALLNLQSDYIDDELVVRAFQESKDRIRSMALVHEKLYGSQDLSRVDFEEYIHSLAPYLFHSNRTYADGITLKTEVEDAVMGVDLATPCGLIVCELVSNALKHAFPLEWTEASPVGSTPDGPRGEITIGLCSEQGRFILTVADDGVGFPPDVDYGNAESLGLRLVVLLAEQLGGTIELLDGPVGLAGTRGTAFRIEFEDSG